MTKETLIRLIDDEESVLRAQSTFLTMAGYRVQSYQGALAFLEQDDFSVPGCLVLDVRMPQMSGIELQNVMLERKIDLPIIFLSAHGDIEMAVEAVRKGAKSFLVKPPQLDKLTDLIEEAVADNLKSRSDKRMAEEFEEQWAMLTESEKQVALMVGKGLMNSVIGEVLDMTERTVRGHREAVYEKLEVSNAAELATFIHELQDCRKITESDTH